ncbi:MAG: hypothetical protein AAGJ54_06105 [Planctomycetota bacterium]
MNAHERVHLDSLVNEACDLLCETSIQRCEGPTKALQKLRSDPNGHGVWLDKFIGMFLSENAMDNLPGACAILEFGERRAMPAIDEKTVGKALLAAGEAVFTDLVRNKADQALEQASIHEGAVV